MELIAVTTSIPHKLQKGSWKWSGKCLSIWNKLLPQTALVETQGCLSLVLVCWFALGCVTRPWKAKLRLSLLSLSSQCPQEEDLSPQTSSETHHRRSPSWAENSLVQLFSQGGSKTCEIHPVLIAIATHPREASFPVTKKVIPDSTVLKCNW